MAFLPWEIVVEILCQLPVKDLLRYRTVCKAWCALIDGSDFIKRHLKHSMETSSNLGLVLRGPSGLHWLDLETLDWNRLSDPIDDGGEIVKLFGGCDGLLAVKNRRGDLALWNPSTRRYKTFPVSEVNCLTNRHRCPFYTVGLGYDPVSDDHKLLRIINPDKFFRNVDIYSVKTNTWKRINNFPYLFPCHQTGIHVCNALHWLSGSERNNEPSLGILAFDLVTETFYEVELPDLDDMSWYTDIVWRWELVELGGCLCLVVYTTANGVNWDGVDVYVMKEYKVKESWIKLFAVETGAIGSFLRAVPIAYLKGGDQVLLDQELLDQDNKKFVLYDLQRRRAENVRTCFVPKRLDMQICVDSLVGLERTDAESAGKQAWENRERNKRKEQSSGNETRDDFLFKGFKLL